MREYVASSNDLHGIYNADPDAMSIGGSLNVAEQLFDPNWHKQIEEMTPEEFRSVFDSLKSIDHYGRGKRKVEVRGAKEDLNEVVSGLRDRLKAAVDNQPAETEAHRQSAGRLIGSWILNPGDLVQSA